MNVTSGPLIGQPVERAEDHRFLTGAGQFVDDLARPGMLHAVILRSQIAHGRVRFIDPAAALARPGVHAVITSAEIGDVPIIPLRLANLPEFKSYLQPVIAKDKVRYVGEPLAVVVADTQALAEDALEAVSVEIEPLPPSPTATSPPTVSRFCSTAAAAIAPCAMLSRSAMPMPPSPRPTTPAARASAAIASPRCRWKRGD